MIGSTESFKTFIALQIRKIVERLRADMLKYHYLIKLSIRELFLLLVYFTYYLFIFVGREQRRTKNENSNHSPTLHRSAEFEVAYPVWAAPIPQTEVYHNSSNS